MMNISNPTTSNPWCHHPQLNMSTYAGTPDDKIFSFWVEGVSSIFVGVLGLLGNTLTVIIMKRKDFRETLHKLLIALAVFDNVFIMAALCTLIIRTFSLLDYDHLRFLTPIFLAMMIIGSFAMVTSMYLTLAISIERYFGICYPIQSRVRRTRRVFVYLLPVIVGSLVYNSPKLLEISTNGRVNVDISDDPLYNKIYKQYLELLFTVILPLLGLVLFNMKVYLAIRENRRSSMKSTRAEMTLAKFAISIVITFLVCHVPRIYLQSYRSAISERTNLCWSLGMVPTYPSWMFSLTAIQHFLLIVNSSVNFIIYCFLGTKFRRVLVTVVKNKFSSDAPERDIMEEETILTDSH